MSTTSNNHKKTVSCKGAGSSNRNGVVTPPTANDECTTPTAEQKERRLSRDIGTQAYSIEFENERTTRSLSVPRASISTGTDTRDQNDALPIRRSNLPSRLLHSFCPSKN